MNIFGWFKRKPKQINNSYSWVAEEWDRRSQDAAKLSLEMPFAMQLQKERDEALDQLNAVLLQKKALEEENKRLMEKLAAYNPADHPATITVTGPDGNNIELKGE